MTRRDFRLKSDGDYQFILILWLEEKVHSALGIARSATQVITLLLIIKERTRRLLS